MVVVWNGSARVNYKTQCYLQINLVYLSKVTTNMSTYWGTTTLLTMEEQAIYIWMTSKRHKEHLLIWLTLIIEIVENLVITLGRGYQGSVKSFSNSSNTGINRCLSETLLEWDNLLTKILSLMRRILVMRWTWMTGSSVSEPWISIWCLAYHPSIPY